MNYDDVLLFCLENLSNNNYYFNNNDYIINWFKKHTKLQKHELNDLFESIHIDYIKYNFNLQDFFIKNKNSSKYIIEIIFKINYNYYNIWQPYLSIDQLIYNLLEILNHPNGKHLKDKLLLINLLE